MSLKKILLLASCLIAAYSAQAQDIVAGIDFTTRFDNREYSDNRFNIPQTLFSARLTPHVGVEWMEKNRFIFGVDLLQDFGKDDDFMTRVRPEMYYQFKTANVQANAGIFDRKELMGSYNTAFFSDSTAFYHNRMSGFLGRYVSTKRPDTFVEVALDWEGMLGEGSREKFRVISAGQYGLHNGLYFGYAFSLFHFAAAADNHNVTDNMLLNPYIGWKFTACLNFDIRAGFLFAPQRGRSVNNEWKKQKGGQLDFTMMTRWGLKFENNLYVGENLQPLRNFVANPESGITYGEDGLYAGDSFYATTEHVYNRTFIGYERKFFKNTVALEAGMLFHYDGVGLGNQQVVKLSVALEKLFRIGGKSSK